MKMNLLTLGNTKTLKGESLGYLTGILHLSPATLSGVANVCPKASAGCKAACLNTAGRGGMFRKGETTNAVQKARVRRTQMLFNERDAFMSLLVLDIRKLCKQAAKLNMVPAVRLNGTSDLRWEVWPVGMFVNIFAMFPDVQFYDYTKIPNRRDLPENYHLTFSLSESNDTEALAQLERGVNVAVVFKTLPAMFMDRPVISGDTTDLRFLDPKNVIVGLTAKGRAKQDVSGFVR